MILVRSLNFGTHYVYITVQVNQHSGRVKSKEHKASMMSRKVGLDPVNIQYTFDDGECNHKESYREPDSVWVRAGMMQGGKQR